MRADGYSYSLINKELGISKSTMSYWFRDKKFTPNKQVLDRVSKNNQQVGLRRHNARVKQISELKTEGIKEIGKLSKRDLWLVGVGLYIGEGSKTTEDIRIINSDPAVIRLGVKWLKEICELDDKNITLALHIYPDHDEEACIKYWQEISGLPRGNFRKTQIDRRKNKKMAKRGRLPYGTAHLRVASCGDPNKGVRLYRRLNGWMAGVLERS